MSRTLIKGLKLKSQSDRLNPSEIAEAIEKGFLSQRRPPSEWTQKKTFSPSTIGYGHGTCARYWYLVFKGLDTFEDNVDSLGAANMSLGTAFHTEIQKALKAGGLLVEEEVDIRLEDPPIHGYADAIVRWKEEDLVCEIKTTRQESFVFKESSGKPSANHLIQILLYLHAKGLKRGFLLYVNKNDQTFLVIPVEMDEENTKILNDVLDWLRTVRAAFEAGTKPKIPFTRARNSGEPSNKICRECPVNKTCFSSDDGTIFIPLMEIPKL
jgi:CRISPR/Cas system-associated exonuclease Cas4 (RecB family)